MAATTEISWCDSTFNPWIGCEKVSPGCKHCYASVDTYARVSAQRGLPLWGQGSTRHRTSEANWRKPLAWNRRAGEARLPAERPRVFCASLCDVFEDRSDLDAYRVDLWPLIERCTELDWMLLTKRPQNIMRMIPERWHAGLPQHVWIGTSVENQAVADERIPHLMEVPARVRFLSMEPLLEDVQLATAPLMVPAPLPSPDATGYCTRCALPWGTHDSRSPRHARGHTCPPGFEEQNIHLVIVGGESGPSARPFDLAWARSLRDQCHAAGVAYFFKQAGARVRETVGDAWIPRRFRDRKGGDLAELPADLRIREMPVLDPALRALMSAPPLRSPLTDDEKRAIAAWKSRRA